MISNIKKATSLGMGIPQGNILGDTPVAQSQHPWWRDGCTMCFMDRKKIKNHHCSVYCMSVYIWKTSSNTA